MPNTSRICQRPSATIVLWVYYSVSPEGSLLLCFGDDNNDNNEYLERLTRTGVTRLQFFKRTYIDNKDPVHTYTRARAHTHTHSRARAHTHTHTHTLTFN